MRGSPQVPPKACSAGPELVTVLSRQGDYQARLPDAAVAQLEFSVVIVKEEVTREADGLATRSVQCPPTVAQQAVQRLQGSRGGKAGAVLCTGAPGTGQKTLQCRCRCALAAMRPGG
jgi:hypothetical protein